MQGKGNGEIIPVCQSTSFMSKAN